MLLSSTLLKSSLLLRLAKDNGKTRYYFSARFEKIVEFSEGFCIAKLLQTYWLKTTHILLHSLCRASV
jgi:hypothetical protein